LKTAPILFFKKSVTKDLIGFWKAQEFRTFLLYTGILLHIAMRILASPGYLAFNIYANKLMQVNREFVQDFWRIYCDKNLRNKHLIHLAEECSMTL